MAPAAQLELDLVLNLFRSGAVISPRAKSGLVGYDSSPCDVPVNCCIPGCFDAPESQGPASTRAITY